MTGTNGVQLRLRSAVIGFLIGCGLSIATGVWLTYVQVIPGLQHEDQRIREDFQKLEVRFNAMVTRFDALDKEERTESAHSATMQASEQTTAVLLTELTAHIHSADGRMDGIDTREAAMQVQITRLQSSLDALCRASGVKTCGH